MSETAADHLDKERLVESLTSARDVTKVAVRDDILPAVAAVALAAKDAAVPAYNEAHQRAGNAVIALKGSDAAAALLAASAAGAEQVKRSRLRLTKKRVFFLSMFGAGTTYIIMRKRNAPAADIYASATTPSVVPAPESDGVAQDEPAETAD
jgi:hypothetical protein